MMQNYYDHIVYVQSRAIQDQYATGLKSDFAHQRFMGFIFSDPNLLIIAMLISVRGLLSPSGESLPAYAHFHVIQLYNFLIKSVNTALDDKKRSLSNHTLVCIALLAAYEVKHGSLDNYHLHMRGLVQMIELRGGIHAVGLQESWIERFLLWNDVNSAEIAHCQPYCSRLTQPSALRVPKADMEVYKVRFR
nr:hypothetical protein CFP56_46761 [Quercus suber]